MKQDPKLAQQEEEKGEFYISSDSEDNQQEQYFEEEKPEEEAQVPSTQALMVSSPRSDQPRDTTAKFPDASLQSQMAFHSPIQADEESEEPAQ